MNATLLYILIVGDALANHNNRSFTTMDRNNQIQGGGNCAITYQGAWWYNNCYSSNLNGIYLRDGVIDLRGIVWFFWKDTNESLKRVEMKIRAIVEQE